MNVFAKLERDTESLSGIDDFARMIQGRDDFNALCDLGTSKLVENHTKYRNYGRLFRRVRFLMIATFLYVRYHRAQRSCNFLPTVKELKTFNKREGLVSDNSVNAWVLLAESSGYLRRQRNPRDGRSNFLVLTPAFEELIRDCYFAHMTPASRIQASIGQSCDCLSDDFFIVDVFEAMLCNFGLLAAINQKFPLVSRCSEILSGVDVIALLYSSSTQTGQFLPSVNFPYNAIAARFRVTRNHVRMIVEGAAQVGLLTVEHEGGKHIVLHETFRDTLRAYLSMKLAAYSTILGRVDENLHAMSAVSANGTDLRL